MQFEMKSFDEQSFFESKAQLSGYSNVFIIFGLFPVLESIREIEADGPVNNNFNLTTFLLVIFASIKVRSAGVTAKHEVNKLYF